MYIHVCIYMYMNIYLYIYGYTFIYIYFEVYIFKYINTYLYIDRSGVKIEGCNAVVLGYPLNPYLLS
jgi:hypothetical protein